MAKIISIAAVKENPVQDEIRERARKKFERVFNNYQRNLKIQTKIKQTAR